MSAQWTILQKKQSIAELATSLTILFPPYSVTFMSAQWTLLSLEAVDSRASYLYNLSFPTL